MGFAKVPTIVKELIIKISKKAIPIITTGSTIWLGYDVAKTLLLPKNPTPRSKQ